MPIIITDSERVYKAHVEVKVSGWVRAYDDHEYNIEESMHEYEGLVDYPPHIIERIEGKVTYEKPYGEV